jgi:osmotically-inducible protein OsmY
MLRRRNHAISGNHIVRMLRYFSSSSPSTDRLIAFELLDYFEKDLSLANISGIHFHVRDSNVRVTGCIGTHSDRDILLTLVRRVPGVRSVENRVRILN